jgi:hypothetical protein
VNAGDLVEVRIRIGPQTFEDRFCVIRMSQSHAGPISFHLRLEEQETVQPPVDEAEMTPAAPETGE